MSGTDFLRAGLLPSREPLSLQVARILRDAILTGELADGTAIPSEKDLATSLGVGRSTIREALRILQAQGLLSGGDRVTTRRPAVDASGALPSAAGALEAAIALGQLPLSDLVSLRVAIELAALRELESASDLGLAHAAIDAQRAAGDDPVAFHAADVAFHAALVQASGNRAYILIMSVSRSAQAAHLLDALRQSGGQHVHERLIAEHEAILDALSAGRTEHACALMRRHIEDFYAERMA